MQPRDFHGVPKPEEPDGDGFAAPFGPTTVERNDPMFLIKKTCCWWSGQSWPYATSQTLKAMANVLQGYEQDVVTKADYLKLLRTFARTHRQRHVGQCGQRAEQPRHAAQFERSADADC